MRMSRPRTNPLGAMARGAVAGAAGTIAMDALWFSRYRREGGDQDFISWETAEGTEKWDDAAAPGRVGRRLLEAVLHRDPPDRWARTTTNVVHCATGMMWGAQYGILAASTKRHRIPLAVAFGPAVWLSSYLILPLAKVYKPIWEYDAKTLAKDLGAHLVYGSVGAAAFAVIAR
jgi:hypothetical protein